MHLLLAQKGAINEGDEAVDLGQSPGDIVFLSAADTELVSLAVANRELANGSPVASTGKSAAAFASDVGRSICRADAFRSPAGRHQVVGRQELLALWA